MKILLGLLFTAIICTGAVVGTSKFGKNPDIDQASVPEDVWPNGSTYSFPAAAAATTIVSGNVADDDVGSGARTVRVSGLDANYSVISEDVSMSGTGAVTLTNQFLRVNSMKVLTDGGAGSNSGQILLKHSSTVIGEIPSGAGEAPMAIYTIHTAAKLKGWSVSSYGIDTSRATFRLDIREYGGSWATIAELGTSTTGATTVSQSFNIPKSLPKKTDIRVQVSAVGADNTLVSAHFELDFN